MVSIHEKNANVVPAFGPDWNPHNLGKETKIFKFFFLLIKKRECLPLNFL